MQPSPKLCPTCQAPIPPDAPGGLCPACLLLGAAIPTQPMPGALASAPKFEEVSAAFPELEVVELFAHGGMGVIYKARQPRLDRFVALKILPPDLARQPGFTERFTREARALARLNHPHIVAVYDFGERAGLCFLIMEFVDGVNLRQAMRAGVTPEQALTLVPPICEALQFAHDHGVLHRDVKPENILLDRKGTPKLADFGIAKLAEEKLAERALTMSGAALGTAAYMAPEQIERPASVDHRADIYSLGVVLYEMLTGELPLGRFAAPSSKAKVNAGVDDVVFRALEKERDLRQQSATEMKTQVERAGTATRVPSAVSDDDWVLRCPACGHIWPFAEVGIRIGAASFGKRVVSRCPACGFRGAATVLKAGVARAENFVPDPAAAQRQGRIAAVLGALLNLIPAVLLLLVLPNWLSTGPRTSGFGGEIQAAPSNQIPIVTVLMIPSALAGLAGLILTAVALWAARYRAPWFFWWLMVYGALTSPLLIGVAILASCLPRRDEFFRAIRLRRNPAAAAADPEDAMPLRQVGMATAAITLPLAILIAILLLPTIRGEGYSSWLVVPIGLGFLVIAATWVCIAVATRRSVQRAGTPRWAARLVLALLILPLPVLLLTMVSSDVIEPRPIHTYPSYQTQTPIAVVTAADPQALGKWEEGSAELIAITRHPAGRGVWWRMDGAEAHEGPFVNSGNRVFPQADEAAYEFYLRLKDLPAGASLPSWIIERARSSSTGGLVARTEAPKTPLAGYHIIAATLPRELVTTNLKAGLAYERWRTISRSHPRNSTQASRMHEGVEWNVTHGVAIETKDGKVVTVFSVSVPPDWDSRVAAVRQDGSEVPPTQVSQMNEQSEWRFDNLGLEDVQELRFQVRPIRWVEFRNVALRPSF